MKQKEKTRFMKCLVWFCVGAIIAFAIASYIAAWFEVDTVPILEVVAAQLGRELILTAILKLVGEKIDTQKDAKAAATPAKKATG